MKVVVDASVVVKWFLPDPHAEPDVNHALRVLREIKAAKLSPLQPPHWLAEAAAVIARLHPKVARQATELLYAMQLPVSDSLEVYTRSVDISEKLNHHVFDTLYHAVALEHDATLISADEKYVRKAQSLGSLILLRTFGENRAKSPPVDDA